MFISLNNPRDIEIVIILFSIFLVKYEARLDDGTIVSKSHEGVEFCVSNGKFIHDYSYAVFRITKLPVKFI